MHPIIRQRHRAPLVACGSGPVSAVDAPDIVQALAGRQGVHRFDMRPRVPVGHVANPFENKNPHRITGNLGKWGGWGTLGRVRLFVYTRARVGK